MPYPQEGTIEWYEAIARSHLRCVTQPRRFRIPQLTPEDHLAKAAEAESIANALRQKLAPAARVEPQSEPQPRTRKQVQAERRAATETQLPLGLTLL